MTINHTPGPWVIGKQDHDVVMVDTTSGTAICDVYVDSDERPANARLIAAAPDLVAALEPFGEFARMMDEIEHVKTTPDDAVIHPGLTVGHFRRAREVVAKAKGEA